MVGTNQHHCLCFQIVLPNQMFCFAQPINWQLPNKIDDSVLLFSSNLDLPNIANIGISEGNVDQG
jgi:hypothetical protein